MAATIETLEKLERKMTLSLPVDTIRNEVDARLRKLSRTVRMDGFRPGKVPMNIVAQRYGYSVQYEVINDKVGEIFFREAAQAKLRVAGQPPSPKKTIRPKANCCLMPSLRSIPKSSWPIWAKSKWKNSAQT